MIRPTMNQPTMTQPTTTCATEANQPDQPAISAEQKDEMVAAILRCIELLMLGILRAHRTCVRQSCRRARRCRRAICLAAVSPEGDRHLS